MNRGSESSWENPALYETNGVISAISKPVWSRVDGISDYQFILLHYEIGPVKVAASYGSNVGSFLYKNLHNKTSNINRNENHLNSNFYLTSCVEFLVFFRSFYFYTLS